MFFAGNEACHDTCHLEMHAANVAMSSLSKGVW